MASQEKKSLSIAKTAKCVDQILGSLCTAKMILICIKLSVTIYGQILFSLHISISVPKKLVTFYFEWLLRLMQDEYHCKINESVAARLKES